MGPELCFYCDDPMKIGVNNKTVDHIVPKWLGGTNHEKNKVKCCYKCNTMKANMLPKHWAEIIEWFLIPRTKRPEDKDRLRKIHLKCVDLEMNHIPKHKNLMVKKPFAI